MPVRALMKPRSEWVHQDRSIRPSAAIGFLLVHVLALGVFVVGFSWTGLFWGFFLSTVLLWHGTFSINSLTHVFGRRVFPTSDTSRNSFLLAVATMGEGWHNNHHYYPSSAAQGFRWWQIDVSYYLLWLLEQVRIVRGLRPAPSPAAAASALAAMRTRLEAAGEEMAERALASPSLPA